VEVLLALFNFFLVLFAYLLWRATSGAWQTVQDQSRDLRRSIEVAERAVNAAATGVEVASQSASLAGANAEAAVRSADASAMSAKAAETALIARERPYLLLVVGDTNFAAAIDSAILGQATRPALHFTVKNYGQTPAILKRINAELALRRAAPEEIGEAGDLAIPAEVVLLPGAATAAIERPATLALDRAAAESLRSGSEFLWFYGRVVYDDMHQAEHETRFLWRYDGHTERFAPISFRERAA
jgi:hypothetical protein